MLKFLRKKGVMKKVIWVVAILIILSFGFLGTAYLITDINQTISHAGKIFGKKISFDDWRQAYEEVRVQSIMRYGDKFSQVQQYLDFDKETWDRLILLHEAKRQKIKISDEDIIKEIEQYPFFQREGQFDTLLYNDILRYVFKIRPREFEESVRADLQIQKVTQHLTADIAISDEDLFAEYNQKNEKAQVSYAFFSAKQYMNEATFDETKAQAYYDANKESFRLDDMISVDYVYLKYPLKPIALPEENIENTGADISNEEPKPLPQPEYDTTEIDSKADEIYAKLITQPDLNSIAAEYKLPIENTDYFSMNQPNLTVGWSFQLLTRLFDEEVGYIPGPIETSTGIYLVQIADKKASHIPPFKDVMEQVRTTVLQESAAEIAQQKANTYKKIIEEKMAQTKIDDFADVVKELGLEVHQTPLFIRGQYLPKIGISNDFADTAFNLTKEHKVSDVIKVSAGYCILHLDDYVQAEKEKFEEEKDAFRSEFLAKKQQEAFNDFMTKLRIESKIVDNIVKMREQQAAGQ